MAIVTTAPITNAAVVTTSDTLDLPGGVTRMIMVAATGNVRMTFQSGATVTLNCLVGVQYPFAVSRIWATGTTATGISALY